MSLSYEPVFGVDHIVDLRYPEWMLTSCLVIQWMVFRFHDDHLMRL